LFVEDGIMCNSGFEITDWSHRKCHLTVFNALLTAGKDLRCPVKGGATKTRRGKGGRRGGRRRGGGEEGGGGGEEEGKEEEKRAKK